jgi:hypothetical protein
MPDGGGQIVGAACEAALAYASRGWPVFPRNGPRPLTTHGYLDASLDPERIRNWWNRWPRALIGVPTGAASGVVVLDIDRKNGADGFETLENLGFPRLPDTPMVHSPHDGLHLYFGRTGELRCSVGKYGLGPGLDVRGDGGSITVPTPGHRYVWDAACNPATVAFRPAPDWLGRRAPRQEGTRRYHDMLRPDELLLQACRLIRDAPEGERHEILNRQAFLVACLVSRGALEEARALHELRAAAATMVWGTHGNQRKAAADLASAFRDGMRRGRR